MPRAYCAVYECLNSAAAKPELSFFKLPTDVERRSKWLRLIFREDLMNRPPHNYTVCEIHFNTMDIMKGTNRKKLKSNSLPALQLPGLPKKVNLEVPVLSEACTQTEENLPTNTNTVPEETPEVIKVFCPKCKSEVSHTAEGIQMDQKDQLIAKVYHYFEQEYEELKRTIPGIEQSALAQLRQRTARATGVSETAVADVLAEEARRNEVRVKEEKRRSKEPLLVERKTRIRSMQDESSGEECNYYSSDEDNDDRFEATETLVIKEEPLEPEYEEPAEPAFLNLPSVKLEPGSSEDPKELVDPIAINIKKEPGVKTEPNEEEATTKRRKLCSNEENVVQGRAVENIENVTLQENHQLHSQQLHIFNNLSSNGTTGATTSIKKRKIKTETPPATSSSPTTSSPPKRRLMQIKDIKVKVEKEEIKEEGNS